MRLHHVNVICSVEHVGDVVDFYGQVLGLHPIDKPAELDPRGAWFQIDGQTQLHVSVREGAPHPDPHFALAVDDLDGLVARLEHAGAPWAPAAPVFGGPRGFTRDPMGNRIELFQGTAG